MMANRWIFLASLGALVASPAVAEIGRIKSVIGIATVQRAAARIPASTGQELLPGDWLETGKDSRITLTFVDFTRFAVGPDSRIALTKFDYDPTSQTGSFVAQVERGTIAVVSGKIAKTRCGGQAPGAEPSCGGMEIRTPDAKLDIRGTRFIVSVPK